MELKNYVEYFENALKTINNEEVSGFIGLIIEAYRNGKNIFVIGNGGSAANASHLAQDLSKGVVPWDSDLKRIKAISLTDNVPFITALGNDLGFDRIFTQQVSTYAESGDYLISISGSGNSENILNAVEWSNRNGLKTIGITGFDGGKLKKIVNHSVHVPLSDMCTVESIHSFIFHYVVIELMEILNKKQKV